MSNYYPFTNLKLDEILKLLDCDIFCFQGKIFGFEALQLIEIKSTKADLELQFHTLEDYHCFYDLNPFGGRHGVGYYKQRVASEIFNYLMSRS